MMKVTRRVVQGLVYSLYQLNPLFIPRRSYINTCRLFFRFRFLHKVISACIYTIYLYHIGIDNTACSSFHLITIRIIWCVLPRQSVTCLVTNNNMVDRGAGYLRSSSQPQSGFLPVPTCNNGDCSDNLPSVHEYLRFSRVSHLPALSSRLLAIRARRVGHLKVSPYPFTRILALHQRLISSTIRTSCPTFPRLSVGGGRTVPVPVHPRGSP